MKKKTVLFICTHNSARSQMAEGYLRVRYGTMFDVGSAGTEVRKVHPLAVAVMEEIGVDISRHRSKLIDEFFDRSPDIVVTVCDSARQACPFFPGAKTTIHAAFPDPSACGGIPDECHVQFRRVRDAIITWIDTTLVPEYGNEVLPSKTGIKDMVSGQVLLLIYTICKYYIEIILSIYLQNEVCKKFSSIRLRYA